MQLREIARLKVTEPTEPTRFSKSKSPKISLKENTFANNSLDLQRRPLEIFSALPTSSPVEDRFVRS
jgi:hypothetical protein